MEKNARSYFMIIGSMLIFATIGIFRRYIPLSSGLLAFVRGVMGSLFLIIFALITKKKIRNGIGKKALIILVISGIMIGFNWILLFESYSYTSVSTATLCYYMQPTIVILLSPIFFKEKLTLRKLVCAIVAIIGMVLVSGIIENRTVGASDLKGIIFGLSAAALYSAVVILNKICPAVDSFEKTIIQLSAAAIVMIPYLAITEDFTKVSVTPIAIVLVIFVGIVNTGIAYALYFSGMPGLPGQSVALLSYIDPVGALILSAVILKERMSVPALIGAVLIIGAAAASEINIKRRNKHLL